MDTGDCDASSNEKEVKERDTFSMVLRSGNNSSDEPEKKLYL